LGNVVDFPADFADTRRISRSEYVVMECADSFKKICEVILKQEYGLIIKSTICEYLRNLRETKS
jgi:hypothetical protein